VGTPFQLLKCTLRTHCELRTVFRPKKCRILYIYTISKKFLRLRNDPYRVGWGAKLYSLSTRLKSFPGLIPPPRTLAKNAFVAWTRTLVFLFFDHWYASELNLTALPPTQHTFGSFGGVARVTRVGGGRISPIIVAAESDMGPLFCRLNPTQCIKCRVLSRTRKLCATNYCNACLTA